MRANGHLKKQETQLDGYQLAASLELQQVRLGQGQIAVVAVGEAARSSTPTVLLEVAVRRTQTGRGPCYVVGQRPGLAAHFSLSSDSDNSLLTQDRVVAFFCFCSKTSGLAYLRP